MNSSRIDHDYIPERGVVRQPVRGSSIPVSWELEPRSKASKSSAFTEQSRVIAMSQAQLGCIDDPALFTRDTYSAKELSQVRVICNDCPVQRQCFELAQTTHPTAGVWGGVPHNEIRRGRIRP